jgi:hypothetical protein
MPMITPTLPATRQRDAHGPDAGVIDLHRWQRARDAEARHRSMASHPAGSRRQVPAPVAAPVR